MTVVRNSVVHYGTGPSGLLCCRRRWDNRLNVIQRKHGNIVLTMHDGALLTTATSGHYNKRKLSGSDVLRRRSLKCQRLWSAARHVFSSFSELKQVDCCSWHGVLGAISVQVRIAQSVPGWEIYAGFQHIFKNHFAYFFNTFSILNQKTAIPSLSFIFQTFYSWNTMPKTSAKLPSVVKNKFSINKWLNLKIPHFFNALRAFWPN